MGGLFGGGSSNTSTSTTLAQGGQIGGVSAADAQGRKLSSGGFPDDGARRMPSSADPVAAENARKREVANMSMSGRQATALSGTRPFVNTFLGGTK